MFYFDRDKDWLALVPDKLHIHIYLKGEFTFIITTKIKTFTIQSIKCKNKINQWLNILYQDKALLISNYIFFVFLENLPKRFRWEIDNFKWFSINFLQRDATDMQKKSYNFSHINKNLQNSKNSVSSQLSVSLNCKW